MKRIVFLIIATLLVLGLILPGCGTPGPTPRPKIVIGVPYPFGDIQGTNLLAGAQMAAAEINAAGGVNVTTGNTTTYDIQIVGRNDNEIADAANAWKAVDYLINTAGAKFIVGGFRTEAAIPMLTQVFATETPSVPFLITGSATAELLSGLGLLYPSPSGNWPLGSGTPYFEANSTTSGFYKYIFRTTPFNTGFLLAAVFGMFTQVAQQIQSDAGWGWNGTAWPNRVRVAVVGENLTWAAPIVGGLAALVSAYKDAFGWNYTLTRTFSDKADSGVVAAALDAVQAAQNQIILTVMSGPVGITFGTQMGARNITAIPVGINVEAQGLNYYASTQYSPGKYGSSYEVTLGTYAQGVNTTGKTAKFLADYQTFTGGAFPIYTAASYDAVYAIKEAIVGTNSLDIDLISDYMRATPRESTSMPAQFYPVWDQVTHNTSSGRELPAQNSTVIAALYAANGYDAAFNFTMHPYTTNDLVFGPGYATGIGVQWINTTQVAMWPKAGFDAPLGPLGYKPQTTMTRKLCGLNWSNTFTYPGILSAVIPAAYVTQWQTWFPYP